MKKLLLTAITLFHFCSFATSNQSAYELINQVDYEAQSFKTRYVVDQIKKLYETCEQGAYFNKDIIHSKQDGGPDYLEIGLGCSTSEQGSTPSGIYLNAMFAYDEGKLFLLSFEEKFFQAMDTGMSLGNK